MRPFVELAQRTVECDELLAVHSPAGANVPQRHLLPAVFTLPGQPFATMADEHLSHASAAMAKKRDRPCASTPAPRLITNVWFR